MGVFFDTIQFSDTNWVPNNSVHFWHYAELVQTPQFKDSAPQVCFYFKCHHKSQATLWPTGYKLGSQDPVLRFNNLAEQIIELRKTLYLRLPVYHKRHKQTVRWEVAQWGLEGSQAQELLFLWCWDVHRPNIGLFLSIQELIKSDCSRVFIEFNLQVPLSLPGGRWMGWKFQLSSHLDFLVTSTILPESL